MISRLKNLFIKKKRKRRNSEILRSDCLICCRFCCKEYDDEGKKKIDTKTWVAPGEPGYDLICTARHRKGYASTHYCEKCNVYLCLKQRWKVQGGNITKYLSCYDYFHTQKDLQKLSCYSDKLKKSVDKSNFITSSMKSKKKVITKSINGRPTTLVRCGRATRSSLVARGDVI